MDSRQRTILHTAIAVLAANGRLTKREMVFLSKLRTHLGIRPEEVNAALDEAKNGKLKLRVARDERVQKEALAICVKAAACDGQIVVRERRIISALAAKAGVPADVVSKQIASAMCKRVTTKEQRTKGVPRQHLQHTVTGDTTWEWRTLISGNPWRCQNCGHVKEDESAVVCNMCGKAQWGSIFRHLFVRSVFGMGGVATVTWLESTLLRILGGVVVIVSGFCILAAIAEAFKALVAEFRSPKRLDGVPLLDDLLVYDDREDLCKTATALERRLASLLTTPSVTLVAAFGSTPKVRSDAIQLLDDPGIWRRLALLDAPQDVGLNALGCIADEEVIAKIALDAQVLAVRLAAAQKLTNQDVLLRVIGKTSDKEVRTHAFDRLVTEVAVLQAALGHSDPDIGAKAVERLTCDNSFEKLAQMHISTTVRKLAIERIADQKILFSLATTDTDEEVRELAVSVLTDPELKDRARKILDDMARKKEEEERRKSELRQQVRVGMSLDEVIDVLGEPSAHLGGGALLGLFGSVSGSASAISSISQKEYYTWRRPEGEWRLIFVGEKLVEVNSTP